MEVEKLMDVNNYGIYDFISRNAQIYPDRDCIVFNDIRLDHREYKKRCDELAAGLTRAGIKSGDRMGILAQNCPEFMVLYGAAAKMGVIVLPVNCRLQQTEMEYILEDGSPSVVFAGPDYQNQVLKAASKVKSIKKLFAIGRGKITEGFTSIEELYSEIESKEFFHIPDNSGFVIIHTAAVDGRPRGALHSHKSIIALTLQMMLQFQLGPEDCHICHLPLFHMAAIALSFSVMHGGGKNVITEGFDPSVTLRLTDEEKGTFCFTYAPMLKMIMEEFEDGTYNLSSMRNVGGLDQPENIRRFLEIAPGATFWTGYGQTEAVWVTGSPFAEKPGSAGKPAVLAKIALFDDYDREVPVGNPGEICVRSPMVFSGYWGLEEESAYTFRNGWHHTGDIGRFDKDGYLWYLKRKAQKELIKPGGENVYPGEVEEAILAHPSIKEVSVIGVEDAKWGECVKAVCVLRPGETLSPEKLTEFVASRIARYKKPKMVVYVDSLPKKPDGKIDREQVKEEHGGKY